MGEARQYLRHGKALCGKIFPLFVDTFNWLVDFGSNIKGDDDATRGNGHIILDRSDPHHPVIRCKGCEQSSSPAPSTDQAPSPFQYTEAGTIENRNFYFDGELRTISSYTLSNPIGTCSVYLRCSQDSWEGTHTPTWIFSLTTTERGAPYGGRAYNFKLYDFVDSVVTCDYRSTFLALNSGHDTAYFLVNRPRANGYIELDTTGTNPVLTVSNQVKSVTINPTDLTGTAAKFHKLTLKNVNQQTIGQYDVLSNTDITVTVASGTVLKDIEIDWTSPNLTVKKTTINLATGEETEGTAETIFTAVAHNP